MRKRAEPKHPFASLSLKDQAARLGIPFERIQVRELTRTPEITALQLYQNDGWLGAACEAGPLFTLFKALCLDLLASYPMFDMEGAPQADKGQLAVHHFPALCVTYQRRSSAMLAAMLAGTTESIARNFSLIYGNWLFRDKYPGLSEELMLALWKALGPDLLRRILERMMTNPYAYGNGWPDLTIVKNTAVRFVEVKTTDRLHASQLTLYQDIGRPLLLPFHALQFEVGDDAQV